MIRKCAQCGAEFEAKRYRAKYCGNACRIEVKNEAKRKYNAKLLDERRTAQCTKPVINTRRCKLCRFSGITAGTISCDYTLLVGSKGPGWTAASCDLFEPKVGGTVPPSRRAWAHWGF